jgi:hypothetical protein
MFIPTTWETTMNEHELDKSAEALTETEQPAAVDTEVEADALTSALDTLTKAMNTYSKAEDMDEEDMEKAKDMEEKDMEPKKDMEPSSDKEDEEDMDEGDMDDDFIDLEEAMKAMADNNDKMAARIEQRLDAVLEAVKAMIGEMKAVKDGQGDMTKSLNAVASAPVPPRAVTSVPVNAPTPAPTATRGDLINKALTKMQDSQTDSATRYRLRTAIAQLEAGAPLTQFSDLG